MPMELRERMIHLRRKSFVLFASFLLALAGVLAATHRAKPKPPADDESRAHVRTATEQIPIKAQSQQSVAPEAIGPIDRHVVAGGGGTSTGGSISVDGTVSEVGASKPMTGGTLTLNGGFWNTLDATATPTSTPTPSPCAGCSLQFSAPTYNVG